MNSPYEQKIHYRLLKILSQENSLTQREMAHKMGISLGKLNYCISGLAEKGFLKVKRFKHAENKKAYTYLLTPRGMEEKIEITIRFLRRKINEYEEIKRQIEELSIELEAYGVREAIKKIS